MLTFLHLSDIHFRRNHSGLRHDPDDELRNELHRDVLTFLPQMLPVTGILISGDIAYGGKADEFDFASNWLLGLCNELGCEPTRIWCVPGNHDVDRERQSVGVKALQKSLAHMSAEEYDPQIVRVLYDEDGEALFRPFHEYNEFAKRFDCATTRLGPFWEQPLPLGESLQLAIRGINSAMLCGPDDGDEPKNQLAVGACQSTHNRLLGTVRMTLCHHPPAWLKDEKGFEERLCAPSSVPIQLYGHEHRFQAEKETHYLRLHAGAFQPSRTDPGWTPRYNWLRIQVDESSCPQQLSVEVHPRTWTVGRRFEPDSGSCQGEDHFVWSMALDKREFPCNTGDTENMPVKEPAQTIGEEDGLAQIDRERILNYAFMKLPFVNAVRIASQMKLIESGDENVSDLDKRKLAFRRAVEQGCLNELEEMIRQAIEGLGGGK